MGAGRRWIAVAGGAVAVAVVAAGAWLVLGGDDEDPFGGARPAAEAYAEAWQAGALSSLAFSAETPGDDVAGRVADITAGLVAGEPPAPAVSVGEVAPDPADDERGIAQLEVTWTLAGGAEWSYTVPTPLVDEDGTWRVEWSPAAVAPGLGPGEVLDAERVPAERGTVLDATGIELFRSRPVVRVGIATPAAGAPSPTPDQLAATAARVGEVLAAERIDVAALQERLAAAPPDQFVEVVVLRRERYDEVKPQIYDLPGTAFREESRELAPSASFARPVLGSVGPATAEDIAGSAGRVQPGQLVGHGGLQEAFDRRLAGTDGVVVRAVPVDPDGSAEAGSPPVTVDPQDPPPAPRTLLDVEPTAGEDIAVTLDSDVQAAAEASLAGAATPASIVVVRPSTGELVAVANGGRGDDGLDRALEGRYPPGSTFKVVSTLALLEDGLTPDDVVACPPSLDVGGRSFVNAESEALGPVPFRLDFADSCNTAFVGLADRVDAAELAASAAALGMTGEHDLGVPSFGGEVPPGDDAVAHAATMIGQGEVLASPLGMALVASSTAAGRTVVPVLVVDPDSGAPLVPAGGAGVVGGPGGAAAPATSTPTPSAGPPPGLDPAQAAVLASLMREVVTGGTATVLAGVPGPPVAAKTGTAEFGEEVPPRTHAWMIGFQGDLAFAVLVEDGGFGADAAGPVAATFLASLS